MTGDPRRDTEATPHNLESLPVDEYAQHAATERQHAIDDARRLVTADWLITHHGDDLLHYATLTNEQAMAIDREQAVLGTLTLACGQEVAWVAIPDLFSRMGLVRCATCCDVVGIPRGKQSPKNDHECRQVLGLEGSAS